MGRRARVLCKRLLIEMYCRGLAPADVVTWLFRRLNLRSL